MRKGQCSLLPFIREDISGFNGSSAQIIGWQISKLDVSKTWKNYTGKNIKIAVIDTGCDLNHSDISANILDGFNFIDNNNYPIDDNGHGTHIAGIISASNNRLGMVGVAPDSKIIPIKALDHNGNGNIYNISKAIVWAVDRSCDIITMSLGSKMSSVELYKAIKYAKEKGIIIFCAAGNSGNSTPVCYPAKYEETIAVSSINESFNVSEFSCLGNEIDFMSPGENIFSCVPGDSYSIMSGTSMANPFAVGCAALYLELCDKNKIKRPNNRQQYVEIFKKYCLRPKNLDTKNTGHGVIRPVTSPSE